MPKYKRTKSEEVYSNQKQFWTFQAFKFSGFANPNKVRASKGFTLVELMVSVALTGILMVGMSVFFSSTFKNMFSAQTQSVNTEKQYVINEIIRDKFSTIKELIEYSSDSILSLNKFSKNQLPFSYISSDNNHLVFKDVLIFNKILDITPAGGNDDIFSNSGNGNILIAQNGNPAPNKLIEPKNFINMAGFELISNTYYIALPLTNEIKKCDCTSSCPSTCEDISELPEDLGLLNSPTDIVIDAEGKNLYVSDSGNGRVLKYDIDTGKWNSQPIATGLKYPTGLTYYKNGSYERLFFADTLNNKVKSYNISSPNQYHIETVVGEGNSDECEKSAKFCTLNMPTGVYADNEEHALYIADSGNNRILKVYDPGIPDDLEFDITINDNYAIDRVVFEGGGWSGGTYAIPDPEDPTVLLVGDGSNYDSGTRTFSNSNRITVFSDKDIPDGGKCVTGTDRFYSNEEPGTLLLKNGHWIYINGTAFKITSIGNKTDCKIGDKDPTLNKWLIIVDTSGGKTLNAENGDTVFFSNPNNLHIEIDGITKDADFEGYTTTTLKIYDIYSGLAETKYLVTLVGDGLLGTKEDQIEIIASNDPKPHIYDNDTIPEIVFPTGITNNYFANSGYRESGNAKIISYGVKTNLKAISTEDFDKYDYVSDFSLSEPITFSKYNSDKILELVLSAKINEEKVQTYTLNTALP